MFFKFDSISVATLSMYFVDLFNLVNVQNVMLAFIRIVVYFYWTHPFILIQGEIYVLRWQQQLLYAEKYERT